MQRYFSTLHVFMNGAASHSVIVNPFICTLRNLIAMVAVDPGDSDTLTVTAGTGGETLGVYTFGTSLSKGSVGTWAANATYGDHVLTAEEGILIAGSNGAADYAYVHITVEFDPHALTKDTFAD